jgi:hypothetical protein
MGENAAEEEIEVKRKRQNAARDKRPKMGAPQWSEAELASLVEEATVDCYNETEQVTGLYTMIEENLALPFETEVLGTVVVVERIDVTERDEIVALCKRGGQRQVIRLLDLPLPSPPPAGAQWIAAYRHWSRGGASSDWEESDS